MKPDGATVLGVMLNESSNFGLRVTKVGSGNAFARIVRLVEQVLGTEPPN